MKQTQDLDRLAPHAVGLVVDANDGFRAVQPHSWIAGLDPLLTFGSSPEYTRLVRIAVIVCRVDAGGARFACEAAGYSAADEALTEPFENFTRQHQNVRTERGRLIGDLPDLPDFVDFAYVADVARVNAAGLASLAQAPASPHNAQIETAQLETAQITNDTTLAGESVTLVVRSINTVTK